MWQFKLPTKKGQNFKQKRSKIQQKRSKLPTKKIKTSKRKDKSFQKKDKDKDRVECQVHFLCCFSLLEDLILSFGSFDLFYWNF